MVKVYIELTARKSGLTQVGYLNGDPGEVIGSNTLRLPFSLTDEFLADEFPNIKTAEETLKEKLVLLNFRRYGGVKVAFLGNEERAIDARKRGISL